MNAGNAVEGYGLSTGIGSSATLYVCGRHQCRSQGLRGRLKYVDTCPNSPVHGMAFCESHCHQAQAKDIIPVYNKL